MTGHLHLTARTDPVTGRSFLGEQSHRAPMHVGKGHWNADARVLTVHAVNATAGLFAGDAVDWRVRVGAGARLRLIGPSATRVHQAARGGIETADEAVMAQVFAVATGGWLEVWPELFIPHAGSRCRQTTRVEIARGGRLLFCEGLAPGRVAMGEAWAFDALRWATDIVYDGRPVVRERWRMQPAVHPASVAGWRDAGTALGTDAPFYGTVFLVAEGIDAAHPGWQRLHDLQGDGERDGPLWIGVSGLGGAAGWTVKVLARDGAVLRRTLARVRTELLDMLLTVG